MLLQKDANITLACYFPHPHGLIKKKTHPHTCALVSCRPRRCPGHHLGSCLAKAYQRRITQCKPSEREESYSPGATIKKQHSRRYGLTGLPHIANILRGQKWAQQKHVSEAAPTAMNVWPPVKYWICSSAKGKLRPRTLG